MVTSYKGFDIDDNPDRTNFETVHSWLTTTYWSPGISMEVVERGARNSTLVVGAYVPETGTQVGFLRVVSDTTRFAWICDVFVDSEYRGKGLAREMVTFAVNHPDLTDVTRWLLATRDAQHVYKTAGFEPLPEPDRWMQYKPNTANKQGC